MSTKPFWIKERINPQLGTYYVACGQRSQTAAKRMANALYGENIMHEYPDEQSYQAKINELRSRGISVQ